MISISHLYTDLSVYSPGFLQIAQTEEHAVQDAELTGFESGYQAGWDDAVKAQVEENALQADALTQVLQDLSFTYQEAFAKISGGMQPLLSSFVTSVLPEVASDGLHALLFDEIERLMKPQRENMIALTVSSGQRERLEELLGASVGMPLTIEEDPSLSKGQVFLQVNDQEREINTDAIISEVRSAISAYFHTPQEGLKHG